MNLYRPLLANALFPAFEAARGRPTVPLLRYLESTERQTLEQLRDLQLGLLRRLIRHAYQHTPHYREILAARGLVPEDFATLDVLQQLPLLERETVRLTLDARTAAAPPHWVIRKSTSGTTGEPVVVRYNAESRHWRHATRWRAYGWAGHRIGKRALHYWGAPPPAASWVARKKAALDRALKRDLYVDCTPRGDDALAAAVEQVHRFEPHVIVAYSAGAAALARFVLERELRTWTDIPVLVGAERLWPRDRELVDAAFGPAFETYGCREVMLIASECEEHDGMHTSMENLIVELIVRDPGGGVRAARPGELGEIAITDLHNLACPMIRYVTGDVAVARDDRPCACGRGLARVGPIEGRVTETLRDGRGRAVSGMVFNVLFGVLDLVARKFQVTQHRDGSVTMTIVPNVGDRLPDAARRAVHDFAARYLPGAAFAIKYVDDIPLTGAGKRKVVVVEKADADAC